MPKPVRSDQKYLPGLDGLRALAVTAVVAYHLGYGWAQGGLLGVGVFFTLSGYLITDILVGQFAASGRMKLKDFWLRRARRLLPALFVMLAVVTVWVNGFARSFVPGYRGDVIASALYVNNWWYIGQHASYYAQFAPPAPLDHLWSLAVEEQFYLVWPWVVLLMVLLAGWLTKRRRRLETGLGAHVADPARRDGTDYLSQRARRAMAGVALVLAAASAIEMAWLYHPGYDPTRVYEGTDTRAFGLLIGAAVAMVWPTRRSGRTLSAGPRRLLDGAGVVGLVVIGLLVWRTNQYSPFMFRGGLEVLSVATALVVAAVATPGGLVGRALGWRPMRWVGVRSYGIYLWHYPIIVLTAAAGSVGSPVSLGRAAGVVAGTVAIAAISWRFVEEPIRSGLYRRPAPAGVGTATADGPATGDVAASGVAGAGAAGGGRRFGVLASPLAVGGLCLLATAGITVGVTSVSARQEAGVASNTADTGTAGAALAQSAAGAATGNGSTSATARTAAASTPPGRTPPTAVLTAPRPGGRAPGGTRSSRSSAALRPAWPPARRPWPRCRRRRLEPPAPRSCTSGTPRRMGCSPTITCQTRRSRSPPSTPMSGSRPRSSGSSGPPRWSSRCRAPRTPTRWRAG
jgi:peptidoglycan/LPS O-acetylase OafA/YrhL